MRRQAAGGDAAGALRRADHLSVPADAGPLYCAGRCDDGGRADAAQIRRGEHGREDDLHPGAAHAARTDPADRGKEGIKCVGREGKRHRSSARWRRHRRETAANPAAPRTGPKPGRKDLHDKKHPAPYGTGCIHAN